MLNSRSAAAIPAFSAFIACLFLGTGTVGSSNLSQLTCLESQRREIWLTAVDEKGSLIEDLRKEDLALKEDKVPGEIVSLEHQRAEALSVVILIDASASMESVLPQLRNAAQKFVQLLDAGKDQAALVTFAGDTTVQEGLTSDLEKLRTEIGRVKFVAPPGYIGQGIVVGDVPPNSKVAQTAIWDAVAETSRKLFHSASRSRRVIIVFTDGEDTVSDLKMRDAVRQAVTNRIEIVSIGVADEQNFAVNRDSVKKLSQETGGRAFFPKKVGDLESLVRQLETELRLRYSMTYCPGEPKSDKSGRRIEIKFNPQARRAKAELFYRRYL